ncbi:MAG: hypothetical protein M1561_02615, partial [Gammaproteobacteria bacterium]|nr:hypothetical protein [Gammaproteobacteria bacterium]
EVAEKKSDTSTNQATVEEVDDTTEEDVDADDEEVIDFDTSDPKYHVPHLGSSANESPTTYKFLPQVSLTANSASLWRSQFVGNQTNNGDNTGGQLASGDIDGDGRKDLVIGSSHQDVSTGVVRTFYASDSNFPPVVHFGTLSSQGMLEIQGDGNYAQEGGGVVVGDFDRDANSDTISGARLGCGGFGAVSILRGDGSRRQSPVSVTEINGINGRRIKGKEESNSAFGSALGFGYRNGQPFLIIGASGAQNGAGEVYIVPGSSGPWTSPASITNIPGVTTITGAPGDGAGFVVAAYRTSSSSADDVFIGAPFALNSDGKVYVIRANATTLSQIFLNNLPSSIGYELRGGTGTAFGWSLGFLAPISNNGMQALAIGAPFAAGDAGEVTVIYIQDSNYNWTSQTPFVNPDGINWLKITGNKVGDQFGYRVTGIGKFNANSNYTFAVGAPGANSGSGAVTAFFARNDSWPPSLSVATATDGINAVQYNGQANEHVGSAIVPIQQPNGYAHIAVGGRGISSVPGRVYLIYANDQIYIVNKTLDNVYQFLPITIDSSMLGASNVFGSDAIITYNAQTQNAYFSRNGTTTVTFTNREVEEGAVQFTATDVPKVSITATDDQVKTTAEVTIGYVGNLQFTKPPELTTAQRQVTPFDASVVSTSITGANADDVTLYVTTTNGHVALSSDLNTAVSSTTQGEVNNGNMVFVTNGSPYAPTITIIASYNNRLNTSANVIVYFSAFPILNFPPQVTIGEGQTIPLTTNNINAHDLYFGSDKLVFKFTIIDGVVIVNGGKFKIGNAEKYTITLVFLQQLNPLQGLQCNVSVSNGVLITDPLSLIVSFYRQASFTINNFKLSQQTNPVSIQNMLGVFDPNTNPVIDPRTLKISWYNLTHAIIDSKYNPGVPLTEYTFGEQSSIRVTLDGSEFPPSASLRVANSVVASSFIPLNVVRWNLAPKITICSFNVTEDGSLVLSINNLDVRDSDTDRTQLRYVFKVRNGQIVYVSNPSVAVAQAPVVDVDAGRMALVTGDLPPSITVSAADQEVESPSTSAAVAFYRKPVVNACIVVNQGEPVVIDSSQLSATSFTVTDPKQIVFTTSEEEHCKFVFAANQSVAIHSFTLQDVIDKKVLLIPDGSSAEPRASISASDGYAASDAADIVFDFDTLPQVKSNIVARQATREPITSSMLSATSAYADADLLRFNAIVNSGRFSVDYFSQWQINLGDIYFEPDGTDNAPSGSIIVSDGRIQTQVPLSFTFIPESANNNVVKYAVICSCSSGAVGMFFWLIKRYREQQALNQYPGVSFKQQVCRGILANMNLSPCLGAIGDELKDQFESAVNKLLVELRKKNIGTTFVQLGLKKQQQLVKTIVEQTARIILGERGCCYKFGKFFINFCHAQITPEQIEQYAYEIAEAVETVLKEPQASVTASSGSERAAEAKLESVCIEMQNPSNRPPTVVASTSAVANSDEIRQDSLLQISQLSRSPSSVSLNP